MRLKRSVLVVLMTLMIIVSGVFIYLFFTTKSIPSPIVQFEPKVHDFTSKRMYEVDDKFHIDITYPDTGIKVINDFFESYIQKEVENLKASENKYLLLNFESTNLNDFYSFSFYKATSKTEDLKYVLDRTYLFNSDGKKIDLNDVFEGDYQKYFAVLVRNEYVNAEGISRNQLYKNITNNNSSFPEFFFDKDSLNLYYNAGFITDKDEVVKLPIEKLAYYLKKDYQGDSVIKKSTQQPDSFRFVDVNKPMVAFTFDDGPTVHQMDRIAEIFDESQSKATFFILGNRINDKNAPIVKKVYENGHQIANHSNSHPNFKNLNSEQIKEEIETAENRIKQITGQKDTVVRNPYGSYSNEILAAVNRAVVHWNVDTEDWRIRDKEHIYKHVLEKVKDGDVILMHELYQSTIDAVEMVVPKLVSEGYQLVTVDELFAFKGIDLTPGKIYFKAK